MEFHGFVKHVYEILKIKRAILPPPFVPVADKMRREDWLTSYESLTGLSTAYDRIACRIGIGSGHLAKAADIVEEKRDFLSTQFNSLFPKLMEAVQSNLRTPHK
ncbi:MAG: ACP phosphodiesterase [Victivallales bacterium]|jgi:acyl carrier protein phosphodiesterase